MQYNNNIKQVQRGQLCKASYFFARVNPQQVGVIPSILQKKSFGDYTLHGHTINQTEQEIIPAPLLFAVCHSPDGAPGRCEGMFIPGIVRRGSSATEESPLQRE